MRNKIFFLYFYIFFLLNSGVKNSFLDKKKHNINFFFSEKNKIFHLILSKKKTKTY